ncbi:MAG TPA: DUF1802 family protein [Pirellulales bacterium]|jgi:hypothetical protein|nr:DUF1802 family protein [Pirellulales bacterium]
MKTAFKEWAVICRALARGEQVLILRKGGIVEEGGQFRPDHPEFLLFPTYSHQGNDSVVPLARPWLLEMEAEQPEAGTVDFRHWAEVTSALQVRSLAAVLHLRGQHVWSDEVVEERFHRWRDAIYALVVRVYALPQPITLELREEYTGCKSWVELETDVPTAASKPVLGDAEFARRAAEIRAALQAT